MRTQEVLSEHLKHFCAVRVTERWHRLPKVVVESPWAWSKPIWTWRWTLLSLALLEQGLAQMASRGPCQAHSVSLSWNNSALTLCDALLYFWTTVG